MITIKTDSANSLLKRREIIAELSIDKCPSFDEVANLLGEQFKINKENIAVKKIDGKYGKRIFEVSANLYQDQDSKTKFEPKVKVKTKKEGGA